MKKVIYISLLFIGLIFASCQKEQISPVSEMQVPVWDSTSETQRGPSDDTNTFSREGDENGDPTGPGGHVDIETDGDITDPNLDPDAG